MRTGRSDGLWRRRVGVVLWLAFAWTVVMWVLWCFPYVRSGTAVRTSYGLLRWREVSGPEQTGIASILPAGTRGRGHTRALAAGVGCAISLVITGWGLDYARAVVRDLTPRWRCRHCGYDLRGANPRSSVCPECGELPHLRGDGPAFGR